MCVVTKWEFLETIFGFIHLVDVLSVSILKRKNHYSIVGSCLVSIVFSSRTVTRKEQNNNHRGCHILVSTGVHVRQEQPQSGSGALVVSRRRGSFREQGSVERVSFKVSQY